MRRRLSLEQMALVMMKPEEREQQRRHGWGWKRRKPQSPALADLISSTVGKLPSIPPDLLSGNYRRLLGRDRPSFPFPKEIYIPNHCCSCRQEMVVIDTDRGHTVQLDIITITLKLKDAWIRDSTNQEIGSYRGHCPKCQEIHRISVHLCRGTLRRIAGEPSRFVMNKLLRDYWRQCLDNLAFDDLSELRRREHHRISTGFDRARARANAMKSATQ